MDRAMGSSTSVSTNLLTGEQVVEEVAPADEDGTIGEPKSMKCKAKLRKAWLDAVGWMGVSY
jgi:hypothetical protein